MVRHFQNIFIVLIILLVNEVQAIEDGNIEIIETNIVKINRLDGSVSGTVFGPKGRFTNSHSLSGWKEPQADLTLDDSINLKTIKSVK